MWRTSLLAAALTLTAGEPVLLPGEGLAAQDPSGRLRLWGEAEREAPMGSLAKLVWLDRAGQAWAERHVTFRCQGTWEGHPCWTREGHGPLDLPGAARASCNLAFLAWARETLADARARQGPSAARSALQADFAPFLGPRAAPPGPLGTVWIGTGDLLRTSPAAFAAWLAARPALLAQGEALLSDPAGGWVKTGTAAVPGDPQRTCAWAAGVRGGRVIVLRLPQGRGKAEGLTRFRALARDLDAEVPEDRPAFAGDPEGAARLEEPLAAAGAATRDWGPWPEGRWTVHLHETGEAFERATGAPPARAAQWVGATLHLRPWPQLERRDLGALLRHELVHRRLAGLGLRRWEEEARCLAAETHAAPPGAWPTPPAPGIQAALDEALDRGTPARQAWAYRALRDWLAGRPVLLRTPAPPPSPWKDEAPPRQITVIWPPERLPRNLVVDGEPLRPGPPRVWQEGATFGPGAPFTRLEGRVRLEAVAQGWRLAWTAPESAWIAAAVDGELGPGAPQEARRALAAVLRAWLEAHPAGNHPDGSLCPLTHCAVVRGAPDPETREAVASAPRAEPGWVWFCASKGGASLAPRAVWGGGPESAPPSVPVPDDPWAAWTRTLTPAQVQALKRLVRPGLRPGQAGFHLGPSGPYPVEALRLAAGRAFGWTTWPSNACRAELQPDGSLRLEGHGLGHNVGLCLATAIHQARRGVAAEEILRQAFQP